MQLPSFSNFEPFNRLREKMGADEIIDWRTDLGWRGINTDIWRQLHWEGIVVPIEDIDKAPDGTLEYQGQKVTVYIRDQMVFKYKQYGRTREYKFHIAWCETLRKMKSKGRFDTRYVVSRRSDGQFVVNLIERDVVVEKEIEIEMKICKNCLNEIKYNGFTFDLPYTKREKIYSEFTIADYFDQYDSKIKILPPHTPTTAPVNIYPVDFDKLSYKYRQSKNWTCEQCGDNFSDNKKQLHTHHIDGDKSNNDISNFMALCYLCHSRQPGHEHM